MVKVKVTGLDDLFKDLVPDIKREYQKELRRTTLKSIIVDNNILKGKSPVLGQGRFAPYSNVYRNAIRKGRIKRKTRVSPVDLKLSGQMLRSFFVRRTRRSVQVGFQDAKADIHNRRGAGRKRVIRRLMPTEEQDQFNAAIQRDFKSLLRKAVRRIIRQQS